MGQHARASLPLREHCSTFTENNSNFYVYCQCALFKFSISMDSVRCIPEADCFFSLFAETVCSPKMAWGTEGDVSGGPKRFTKTQRHSGHVDTMLARQWDRLSAITHLLKGISEVKGKNGDRAIEARGLSPKFVSLLVTYITVLGKIKYLSDPHSLMWTQLSHLLTLLLTHGGVRERALSLMPSGAMQRKSYTSRLSGQTRL